MLRGSKIPYFKTRKPDPNPTKITRTRQEPEGINPNPTRTREAITRTRPEPDFCYPNPSLNPSVSSITKGDYWPLTLRIRGRKIHTLSLQFIRQIEQGYIFLEKKSNSWYYFIFFCLYSKWGQIVSFTF